MSSLLLAVHSYPDASASVAKFWPYYEKSGADKIIGIGTEDGKCRWPDGVESVDIGRNSYIDGPVLPQRLIETMRFMLLLPYDRFCIVEWDCLFFQPMPEFTGMVSFHAGNQSVGMRANRYWHTPWGFEYEAGTRFVEAAQKLIPQVSGHEASPDVFFGWACEQTGIEVTQPWIGFTRNTIEARDVELARHAYRSGAMAIHGIKSEHVLKEIIG